MIFYERIEAPWFSPIFSIIGRIASPPFQKIIFMRSRLYAFLILCIFLGIPFFLYWYFYEKKVSSLVFESTSERAYEIEMRWNLSYKYFPILDKTFYYKSACIWSCIFSPVPPVRYDIKITSTWAESIMDTVELGVGSLEKYKFTLFPALTMEPILSAAWLPTSDNGVIWVSIDDAIITLERTSTGNVIVSSQKNAPIFFTLSSVKSTSLDLSRTCVILSSIANDRYLIDISTGENIVFPFSENIKLVSYLGENLWKVRTEDRLYEYDGNSWSENLRFTDYIDISSRYRIGYIDANDQQKMSLSNLDSSESLLLFLDRKTGESRIVKRWYTIGWFFYYRLLPAIIWWAGSASQIVFDTSFFE